MSGPAPNAAYERRATASFSLGGNTMPAQATTASSHRQANITLLRHGLQRYWAAMSQENVEVVRRWLAVGTVGPQEVRATVAEFCDADVDYYPVRKFSDARPCHGLTEVSEWLAGWVEAWSLLEWAVHELIEVGDDRVLACASVRGEGRGSGVKLEGAIYQCVWLRHGRLLRVEDHLTLSGALHALGLEGATLEAAGLRE